MRAPLKAEVVTRLTQSSYGVGERRHCGNHLELPRPDKPKEQPRRTAQGSTNRDSSSPSLFSQKFFPILPM
jgi:hypothetical protein